MAIIQPTHRTVDGITFNSIIRETPFFYCTHSSSFWINKSADEDDTTTSIESKLDMFGADTFAELESEIIRLNLTN
jgi:hypothetical protein